MCGSFICVAHSYVWLIHICDSFTDSFICVAHSYVWLIHIHMWAALGLIHLYMCDSFICDIRNSHVYMCDSLIYVTLEIHMCICVPDSYV